jgi:uncharacterized protein
VSGEARLAGGLLRQKHGLTAAAAAALTAVLAGTVALAAAPAPPPAPTDFVTDNVGLLSPRVRENLDQRLREVQARTGHYVGVWIGSSTGGEPLEDFTVRTFAAWRVGRKGIDDGLVIFLFAADRRIRFEVGYGLEGTIPDAISSRIIQDVMAPRLKAGDADGAVIHGVDATLAVLDGQPWSRAIDAQAAGTDLTAGAPGAAPEPPGAFAPRGPPGARRPQVHHGLLYNVIKWILIVAVLLFLITHPSLAFWLLMSLSGRDGGGGFGGGGGGGGFSGGGGRSGGRGGGGGAGGGGGGGGFWGGGGRSGGGGASGSW